LPERLSQRGRAVVSVQLPKYQDSTKVLGLDELAEQNRLTITMFDVGEEIRIEDTARSIASKLNPRNKDVEARVQSYYAELGIVSLQPTLLIISRAG
jgi:hypothetical protein